MLRLLNNPSYILSNNVIKRYINRSITLDELLNLTGAEPDVLKLDCEGCEYDIIEHDYETLRLFRELGIECHPYLRGKELEDCLKYLSRDFKCSVMNNLKSRAIMHCIRD